MILLRQCAKSKKVYYGRLLLNGLSLSIYEIKSETLRLNFFLSWATKEINEVFYLFGWLLWLRLRFLKCLAFLLFTSFWLGNLITIVITWLGFNLAFFIFILFRFVNIVCFIAWTALFLIETPRSLGCLKFTWLLGIGLVYWLEWRLRLVALVRALLKLFWRHRLHRHRRSIIWWTHWTHILRSWWRWNFVYSSHLPNRTSCCSYSFGYTRKNLPAFVVNSARNGAWLRIRAHRRWYSAAAPSDLLFRTIRIICFPRGCLAQPWTIVSFTGRPIPITWAWTLLWRWW